MSLFRKKPKTEQRKATPEEIERYKNDLTARLSTEANQASLLNAMCIAKGIILDILNRMIDNKDISSAIYNKYRDSMLEYFSSPAKMNEFIMLQYLEFDKMAKEHEAKSAAEEQKPS